jgi:hypothetical protein
MDVGSGAYQYLMAQQPLELIHKTQIAKDFHMEQADKQKRWVEQTVSEPSKALRMSYEGHAGTYDAAGKIKRGPEPVEGPMSKSIDIEA